MKAERNVGQRELLKPRLDPTDQLDAKPVESEETGSGDARHDRDERSRPSRKERLESDGESQQRPAEHKGRGRGIWKVANDVDHVLQKAAGVEVDTQQFWYLT